MNQMPKMPLRSYISSAAEIIGEAAAGRMVILVDDEDRENEGDLVIPAQFATADVVNFMARHARGLICLALTRERVRHLELPMMARSQNSRFETAFTASIEARHGVTTGISAADRARTIAVAINPETGPRDITTPGHVFPLSARPGGTLIRAGHTEAAVDLARIAGLNPAGVICEIMNEDGTMARLRELTAFSQLHNIKIGTIADLIAYRSRTEKLVEQVALSAIHHPSFGEWRLLVYRDNVEGGEHLVLTKGNLLGDPSPTLVKMHFTNPISDLLLRPTEDPLAAAMYEIMQAGRGVVILINDSRRDAISTHVTTRSPHTRPDPQMRDYGVGAQILVDLGVDEIILITDSDQTLVGLDGFGIKVSDHGRTQL
jgi:3,4-dihydroxy 2-butanone 4-phosphate synthase/GTP cyclohydrolase II